MYNTDEDQSAGMVFRAEVRELGVLPDSEMAEIREFASLPDKLTYPGITPLLWQASSIAILNPLCYTISQFDIVVTVENRP